MFSKKGSSKLSLGLSYKSRAVSQFMRCLLDCNFFPSSLTTLNVMPEFQKRADPKVQYVNKMLNFFYDPSVKQMQQM